MNVNLSDIVNRDGLSRTLDLLRVRPDDAVHAAWGKRVVQVLLLVALAGAAAALTALVRGHHVMGTTSEISWGVLIATYVFLLHSVTGLCLVSSLGHVFGFKVFEPIAMRGTLLAFLTLLVGFSVIATEIEAPFKLMKWVVLSPNPTAPIWWMGTLYGVYLALLATELFFLFTKNHARAKVAGLLTVVAAVAAHSNLGAVFGLSHSRAFWAGPLVPVSFVATALVCGAAVLILLVTVGDYFGNQGALRPENEVLVDTLRKLLALFLAILTVFTAWKLISGVQGGHYGKYEVTMAALTGPLFVSFWLFEVLLGLVVPLVLLLGPWRRSWRAVALAGFLPMLSIFVMRFNFVLQGQMFSLKPVVGQLGERYTYQPAFKGNPEGFLSYTPSLVEALIVVGAIAAASLLYIASQRVLRMPTQEESHG